MNPDPNLFKRTITGGADPEYYSPFPDGFDLSYLAPKTFMQIEFWSDLLTAWAEVANTALNQPLEALLHIRTPEVQSTTFKALHAEMMGYPMSASVMDDAAYDRLNNNVGTYLWTQGSDSFINFLGYVTGMKLALVRLWTEDYVNFFPSPTKGKTIFDGGTWYPTTHVGIVTAANPNVNEVIPLTNDQITQKFYEEAPIDLVLLWIAESQTCYLGTIFLSMAAIRNRMTVRFRLNGIMDNRIDMSVNMLALQSMKFKSQVDVPCAYTGLYVGVTSYESNIETYPVNSVAVMWTNGPPLTPQNQPSIYGRRASLGWAFTGVGKGKWVEADGLRYNCNPNTGLQLGILMEPTANNYVNSSTDTTTEAWQRGGAPQPVDIGYVNMDGSRSTRWFPTTAVDAITQEVYLSAGTYTAQIVYRDVSEQSGFLPFIALLADKPTLQPVGAWSRPVYQAVSKFGSVDGAGFFGLDMSRVTDLGDSGYDNLGNNWRRIRVTFTLDVNGKVQVYLPVSSPIEYFYVGIEDGEIATSFIPTGACDIGVREEDVILINTSGFTNGGSVAAGRMTAGFDGNPAEFTPNETPVTFMDSDGRPIAAMTSDGDDPVNSAMYGAVVDYVHVNSYSLSDSVGVYPRVSLSWNVNYGGSFAINNVVRSLPQAPLATALTRIGPGWHGHINALVVLPIATDNEVVNNIMSATLDAGILNLGGNYFAGW